MNLTQKETMLLNDLKKGEKFCVDLYTRHAEAACDQSLKAIFEEIAKEEQTHYDTVCKMLAGEVPPVPADTPYKPADNTPKNINYSVNTEAFNKDKFLCSDALDEEKHIAAEYNISVFEFCDTDARNMLNHIEKEEQQHGEKIYKYMAANGMYNA